MKLVRVTTASVPARHMSGWQQVTEILCFETKRIYASVFAIFDFVLDTSRDAVLGAVSYLVIIIRF